MCYVSILICSSNAYFFKIMLYDKSQSLNGYFMVLKIENNEKMSRCSW